MYCKTLISITAIIVFVMLTACSTLERMVYRPDINQGNWLSPGEVSRIHNGMTQQQVAYILGTPMMDDPFGSKTWFYLFRQQSGHQQATQQTVILTFNKNDKLINIKNE